MNSPQWQVSLAEVERSIGDCLETLDRYEAAFTRVLAEAGPVAPKPTLDFTAAFDAKLANADRVADDVERLLQEQDGIWNRWRETLASWHGLIEQPA